MTPIGSRHADVVDRLAARLIRMLPPQYLVRIQNPLTLGDASEPQTDIAIVVDRSYATAHPGAGDTRLVMEVSDATLDYDRDVKLPLYARAGIPEVWIADLQASRLEIFREPGEGRYREVFHPGPDERVSPVAVPAIALRPSDLFGARR